MTGALWLAEAEKTGCGALELKCAGAGRDGWESEGSESSKLTPEIVLAEGRERSEFRSGGSVGTGSADKQVARIAEVEVLFRSDRPGVGDGRRRQRGARCRGRQEIAGAFGLDGSDEVQVGRSRGQGVKRRALAQVRLSLLEVHCRIELACVSCQEPD
jgi:hypothetical protein